MEEELELIVIEKPAGNIYERIIREAFFSHYKPGMTSIDFSRDAIDGSAIGETPKNIGDIIYSFRYRRQLPQDIMDCAPPNYFWAIEGMGDGLYRFRAVRQSWFKPDPNIDPIVLSDRTPDEILDHGRKRDEQAILASIGYNRLLDLFLGCRLERVQSHYRTNVKGIGQIELDECYLGVSNKGQSVVVTVQAKRDKDIISSVQIRQDWLACLDKNDGRVCRPTAVHYDSNTRRLAIMEFKLDEQDEIVVVNEQHYVLQRKALAF